MKRKSTVWLLVALFFICAGIPAHAEDREHDQTDIRFVEVNRQVTFTDIDTTVIYCPKEKIVVTKEPGAGSTEISDDTLSAERAATDDFITDCSTDYGFRILGNSEYASYLQEMYMWMVELMTTYYEGEADFGSVTIDGAPEYYIGAINYSQSVLTSDEIYNVFQSVLFDHPIFYFVKNKICFDGEQVYLLADEAFFSKGEREAYSARIRQMIEAFGAEAYASNYDAAKKVHDTIIEAVDYAYLGDGVTPRDDIFSHGIAGYVSDDKKVVCDGYAKTYAAVLNYLDIENILVTGYGVAQTSDEYEAKDAHAWNLVALGDGKYYFVDVTWDDHAKDGAVDTYFCLGDEIYDTHKIMPTEIGAEKDYLYPLPRECAQTRFTGTDSLKKAADPVYEVTAKGLPDTTGMQCGDNVYGKLDADGVLTISGVGKMWNFVTEAEHACPWADKREAIKKIVIQGGVTSVGEYAFEDCTNLKTVLFGKDLLSIEGFAFHRCRNLEDFELPERLKKVEQGAFAGSDKLESVSLPDQITYLGAYIFEDDPKLKHISIGGSRKVASIKYGMPLVFNCPALEAIDVSSEHIAFFSSDGVLYTDDKSLFQASDGQDFPLGSRGLIQYPSGKQDKSYTLLPETAFICENAFNYTQNLETIVFSERLEEIAPVAIQWCPSLKSLAFPENIRLLGGGLGNECDGLEYMENLSAAELSTGDWASQYKEPGLDGRWCYKMWADEKTGKVVSKVTKGMKVVPVFYGKVRRLDDTFEKEGITYRIVEENPTLRLRPLRPEEIENGYVNGAVCVEKAEKPELLGGLPAQIEYEGWVYNLISKTHMHKLSYVGALPSTCTERGNIPYYKCSCGKCFSDSDGLHEITEESTLLAYHHSGGIANCAHGPICDICGNSYGSIDPTRHEHEELRGEKPIEGTQDGYSGDIYCKDCGKLLQKGEVLFAGTIGSAGEPSGNPQGGTQTDPSSDPQGGTPAGKGDGGKTTQETFAELQKEKTEVVEEKTGATVRVTNAGKLKNGSLEGAEVQYVRPAKNASTIVIPETAVVNGIVCKVTSVGDNACKGCTKLKKVTLGKQVKTIGKNAFSGCKKLKTIVVKSTSLKSVGKNALKGISKKATIQVPKKKYAKYKKLFTSKTGFKKTMKLKKG